MRIEIADGQVDIKGGTIQNGKRAGEPWEIRTQIGYMHNGGLYPVKCKVTLPKGHAGYAAGFYTFAPESYVTGDYGAPQLGQVHYLVREEAAKAVKAA